MAKNVKINFDNMTKEEIVSISMEKNNKGIATSRALAAQKHIWEKAGEPFSGSDHYKRDMTVVRKL